MPNNEKISGINNTKKIHETPLNGKWNLKIYNKKKSVDKK
jgi:hypothetical protein